MTKFKTRQAAREHNRLVKPEYKIDLSYAPSYKAFKEELSLVHSNTGSRVYEISSCYTKCGCTLTINF